MKTRIRATIAMLAAATMTGGLAMAGECPADQRLSAPRELEKARDIGIKRPILAAVPLTGWRGLGEMSLRMRRLTVLPGGIVPTHWHQDRPSIVYVLSGEIWENSSLCAVPILHKAGEWTPEFGAGHGHWWENKTAEAVVLISTDVVPWLDKPHYESSPGVGPDDIEIRAGDK